MRHYLSIFVGLMGLCFTLSSYAITINVQSTTSVSALGFTVNGKNHGGLGSTYTGTNMPSGQYTFGVRVGGAFGGTDISCLPTDGSSSVTLNKDTTAILQFNGRTCTLKLS